MRLLLTILFTSIAFLINFAQETDSSKVLQLDEVIVTATRTGRLAKEIPAQVQVIKSSDLKTFPINNIDDILKSVANVNVNRSWGIFSKNSSVAMRGLEGSDRTLVLIDGVPKNKLSGGPVNWHNINPESIERIEVIKGPASALYGTNSMGGVINIITKQAKEKIEGSVKTFAGKYKTLGGSANVYGSDIKNDKGFYYGFNSFYRQGDGYIFEPLALQDGTEIETYLQEYGAGTKLGYKFDKKNNVEIIYDYYDELRGGGKQVFIDDGSFDKFLTQQFRGIYRYDGNRSKLQLMVHYQHEDYNNLKESLNDYDEYRLSEANTQKTDNGAWLIYSIPFKTKHYFTIGSEIKSGTVTGDEIYFTSPDLIQYYGSMSVYGFFLQDEISLLNKRLKIIAGVRNDIVHFNSGWQEVTDPSKVTGFAEGFYESFEPNIKNAISPKLSAKYNISTRSDIYASFGTGFKPPKLDDLCKSGKINKGFRLANPDLQPETLNNFELGYSRIIGKKIIINTAAYYSHGKDFQYLVGTGDSIDTGGTELKPILERKNITEIEIAGAELSLKYNIDHKTKFNLAYAYNYSIISDYEIEEGNPSKNLSGLYIVEVSPHIFYMGITRKTKIADINLNCSYTGEQWLDDENTIKIDDYFIVNARISKTLRTNFKIWVDLQNIFNNDYIDRKGRLSPGRFLTGGVDYRF
ncbi:MAG: TonB-dependent receptor [Bacteroidales bacterium]|nr:TonB-dependent receptor [Bacteroidales bacterium]